ncbi:SPOR domain-containing protein [Candidatus Fukatsuia symbiotica]|uniref:SPOR domain-containing protein n=1 Tax=Candidatus Fukatsuia TaxID=1927833 RepID=UPI000AFE793D|nr:SPOR domain-containing protein [Candidatus Fukatsuia symbiotica]MEA9444977.1 SPOR domain-containing protein [Candidatus Fukatsuia symbiotica]
MAQKDYVSRERLATSRSKTGRPKRVNSGSMAKIVLVLAVVLSVGFAAGFYFISHNKVDKPPLLPNRNPHTVTGLPPLPEERWRYIKELENRQIGVAKPTEPSSGSEARLLSPLTHDPSRQIMEPPSVTTPKPKLEKEKVQSWLLQCGSFRTVDQAESIRAKLAFDGIESQVTSSDGWNRVLLGPYSSRASIDTMLRRLKDTEVSGCIALSVGG